MSYPKTTLALLGLAAHGITLLGATGPADAQDPDEWDIAQPRGETREITFTTTEGTWMSVDLSPDGDRIVFDLLGHIYGMPASGGEAANLTRGSRLALNIHPVFSPDGSEIAFISDRNGQNNLWIMNADGTDPRAVFTDINIRAMEPVWTPDGEYIVVRQTDMNAGGLFSYGLFMYHRDGGTGIELVPYTTEMPGWPSVSPDGRYLYFHQFVGSILPYGGQDASRGDFQIRRLELATGEVSRITSGQSQQQGRMTSGGAFAPEVSPDGRFLAFGRRIPDGLLEYRGHVFGPRTGLWLRDLETGTERLVMDPVEWDMSQEITRAAPILPRFTWSADGNRIYLSQGGGIRVLHPDDGRVETIPFTARVERTISEMAYETRPIPDENFAARFLRWPTGSPDGRRIVFEGVGKLWIQDASGSEPRRLTPDSFADFEYAPRGRPTAPASRSPRSTGPAAAICGGSRPMGACRRGFRTRPASTSTRSGARTETKSWCPEARAPRRADARRRTTRGTSWCALPRTGLAARARQAAASRAPKAAPSWPASPAPWGRRHRLRPGAITAASTSRAAAPWCRSRRTARTAANTSDCPRRLRPSHRRTPPEWLS